MGQQSSAVEPHGDQSAVAVVVVNYRTAELTKHCLASLRSERQLLAKLKVVVVDGGSGDASAEILASAVADREYCDWVTVLPLQVNGGFGWANNQAILQLLQQGDAPEFIHLLNPDTVIEPGAVAKLSDFLREHPAIGATGSQLLELDGSQAGSAFNFPSVRGELCRGARTAFIEGLFKVRGIPICASDTREVDWVTGASVMFRAEALKEVGLFDEGFFLYHEEIELMWRLRRAGWGVAFQPLSRVRHIGGASTGVHSRGTHERLGARKPAYWYRSRTRLFTLTRGTAVAVLAYVAWLAGHAIWSVRKAAGLAKGAKRFSHQLRDHLRFGLPRWNDRMAAVRTWNDKPGHLPTWMEQRWL